MDMEMITDLMEAVMILCFGLSWPISIRKSWVSRTAKGKSLFFECFIWIGYVFVIVCGLVVKSPSKVPGINMQSRVPVSMIPAERYNV